jgi:hypothetical protein
MSAAVIYKTVFSDDGPKVVYFPKMAPLKTFAKYLKVIFPASKIYAQQPGGLVPLSKINQNWVTQTLVATAAKPSAFTATSDHVIKLDERNAAKKQYEAWKDHSPYLTQLDALENTDDNKSIVFEKDKILHFSSKLENIKEFEKRWNVKSITDDSTQIQRVMKREAQAAFDRRFPLLAEIDTTGCDTVKLRHGSTASGQPIIVARFKTVALYEKMEHDDGLLLPVLETHPLLKTLIFAAPVVKPALFKQAPKNKSTLRLVLALLDHMFRRGVVVTSVKALPHIAIDASGTRLFFLLPICLNSMPTSMTHAQHRQRMLECLFSTEKTA